MNSTNSKIICAACGRKKEKLNATNWSRHLEKCKNKKTKITPPCSKLGNKYGIISTFFKTPATKLPVESTEQQSQEYASSNSSTVDVEQEIIPTLFTEKHKYGELCTIDMELETVSKDKQLIEVAKAEIHKEPVRKLHLVDQDQQYQQYVKSSDSTVAKFDVKQEIIPTLFEEPSNINTGLEININDKVYELSSNSRWKNDPAIFKAIKFTSDIINLILSWGPCQPKQSEMPHREFPKNEMKKSFHENWFHKKLGDGTMVHRDWLSYSPSENKVYCIHCMLFGKHPQRAWVHDGFQQFKNGTIAFLAHETSFVHVDATLQVKLKKSVLPLIPSIIGEQRKQVAFNREIVSQLIEVTKFLGQHSLAFRGHRENWSNIIKGNFKDLLLLLSQHSPAISVHIANIKTYGRKELSFISWDRQNLLINALAQEIISHIKSELNTARLFSISIDSTFDVSRTEQVSFIVRYVEDSGKINERLLAMKASAETTGQALFDLFSKVMEDHNIDWKSYLIGQSYDGAASMQGKYNGLQTKVKELCPQATFVWCHAHRLDLIVISSVGSCLAAMNLFGNLEKVFVFISCSKKRNFLYREKQKIFYPNARIRAIKKVETTRWMSQSYALATVLKTLDAILDTLDEIKNLEGQVDFKTGAECNGLIEYLQSFNFLLTANIFIKIFDFIEPVSRALQSHNIDIILAMDMLTKVQKSIESLRTDNMFQNIYECTKKDGKIHNFDLQLTASSNRRRRVPRQHDEKSRDNSIENPIVSYKVNTYFVILDIISAELKKRFNDNYIEVAKDLYLLTPKYVLNIMEKSSFPLDAFVSICNVYNKFLVRDDVIREYSQFIKSKINLNSEMVLDFIHPTPETNSDLSDDESEEESESVIIHNDNPESMSIIKMYKFFVKNGLISVFPNLFTILKIGVTLPISSASPERSFSKLKIVKTRLRSTMSQNRLEDLMLISCETDVDINTENVINNFARTSLVLTKALMY